MAHSESDERGTTLLLVPVMFLVLLMLAGLTVDWSAGFLAKREALNAADAAANDAAAAAIDTVYYQKTKTVVISEAVAQRVARATISRRLSKLHGVSALTTVTGTPPVVKVVVTGSVDTIFSRAFPFGTRVINVTATGYAVAVGA